jgi:hypothetical protein
VSSWKETTEPVRATAWRSRRAGGLHLSPRTRLLKPGAIRLDPSAATPIARRAASPGPPAPHIVSMFQSGFMSLDPKWRCGAEPVLVHRWPPCVLQTR